jgi:hypothetical protein
MKQIRKLLFILLTTTMIYSCGEAGVGFDVAIELPIDVGTMEIPIPGNPAPVELIIPATTLEFDYNLADVDGFSDAVEQLNSVGAEVFLNGIAYEFSGINETGEPNESLPIEGLRLNFTGIGQSLEIPITGALENTPKTYLDISGLKVALESALLGSKGLNVTFVFETGDVVAEPDDKTVDFDIKVYFDTAIRVRDIAN